MKNKALIISILVVLTHHLCAKTYTLLSPDGQLKATINTEKQISYSISKNDVMVLAPSAIGLLLNTNEMLGQNMQIITAKTTHVTDTLLASVYKRSRVHNTYNQLELTCKNNFKIAFRAFNDGLAYRFETQRKDSLIITDELAEFNFPSDKIAYAAYTNTSDKDGFENQYFNSFENVYDVKPITKLNTNHLIILPTLAESKNNCKICITEADLFDYPGMFLNNRADRPSFKGVFAPVVAQTKQGGHNQLQQIPIKRENYIAKTCGIRSFPWRIMSVVDDDKDLATNDLVFRLATPNKITDTSWIKPGKVAWDWWNDWNLQGVDFKTGINTETYKYYIDFASEQGIEYVILDEGWAVDGANDLLQVVPEIDMDYLLNYAQSKHVGIILWAGYIPYAKEMEKVTAYYAQKGIKGFKIDFMDRDDQEIIKFIEETAKLCAKYHLLVDFHGTCKPAGLPYTYPNVINYEGVNGLEQLKWKDPDYDQVTYDLQIPFIRMFAGPMDYTQGAMHNAVKQNYYPSFSEPMSQGTRCRQLAAYIVFDAPLTMLCDAPTNYLKEPECTRFITQIPTIWDESIALTGSISNYIAIARKKDNIWYIGAMTNWDERVLELNLSFLPKGTFKIEIFQDGVNANRKGEDYKRIVTSLPSDQPLTIAMKQGGGYVARITPQ